MTPDAAVRRAALARAAAKLGQDPAAAAEAAGAVLGAGPDAAATLVLASARRRLGDPEGALALLGVLAGERPTFAPAWVAYGHALRAGGRGGAAQAAYRRAAALDPNLGEAWQGLANLKRIALDDADLDAMSAALAREASPGRARDRAFLHYALGKALEDRALYKESFEHYAAGAGILRRGAPHRPQALSAFVAQSVEAFPADRLAGAPDAAAAAPGPIFVLGLPRSGSTLVEQILASHPQVEGAGELPVLNRIVRDLGAGYMKAGERSPEDLVALGALYRRKAQAWRRTDRPLFTDKTPSHFHHIGLIRLILPGARIVDVRRHPMAAGFSIYKQGFGEGFGFSYDLGDIGRAYRDYAALMAHYDRAAPGLVHRVIYEDLVQDLEGQARRLLAHCGLPFDPACLRFFETRRPVATPSSEQVRQPIFREGLDRWRRYERWLDPLKQALGPALEAWRG